MYEVGAGMSVDRTAYFHDTRKTEIPKNVDPNRIKDNVILIDEIQGRTIKQWINDIMQPHIDAYNAKQKRKDRRIETDYYTWHTNNKNYTKNAKSIEDIRLATEFVLSYGGHDNLGKEYFSESTSPERKQEIYNQAIKLFSKWIDDMKTNYPHLKIGLAVIHADEPNGFIHLHGIITPQATYTKGLPVQCSWSRSLEQDGIESIKDAETAKEMGGFQLARFYKQFREHMEKDLIQEGFTIKEEEHGKKHMSKTAYTEKMAEVDKRIEEAKNIESFTKQLEDIEKIERTPSYNPKLVKTIQHKESILSKQEELVATTKENFEALKSSSDAKKINAETKAKIKEYKKVLEDFKETLTQSDREQALIKENEELKKTIAEQEKTITKIQKSYDKLRTRVIEFLRSHALLNKFLELFRKQDEQEQLQKLEEKQQPKFTTNLEQSQENERER